MPRMITEGETDTAGERSRKGTWFVVGMLALLVGFPLGFFLAMGRAPNWTYTLLYAVLALVAVGAAFAFLRAGGGRGRARRGA